MVRKVEIAIVGKYNGLSDSYLSVIKALKHAGLEAAVDVCIRWISAEDLEDSSKLKRLNQYESAWESLETADGVLVPGGFGDRGVEGKILAARRCREKNIPYFGICLGLQTAVISFARDLLDMPRANSAEFDIDSPDKVVVFMPEVSQVKMGGTMRLGSRITNIDPSSLAYRLYGGRLEVSERHRHRYEVNPQYTSLLEAKGINFSGKDGQRMEIAEIPSHKFFVACQFHPEFTSRPREPNPLFSGFILASANLLSERLAQDGGVLVVGSGWTRSAI